MRHLMIPSPASAGSFLVLLIVLAGLTFATARSVASDRPRAVQAPIYSVAEVRTHLARTAGAWAGRALLVHGVVTSCGPLAADPVYCLAPDPDDIAASAAVDPLPLVQVAPAPLTALLSRLPLLRELVPAAQPLRLGEIAIFRLHLRVQTRQYCGVSVCYEALTDAAP